MKDKCAILIEALKELSKPITISEFSGTIMLPELVKEVRKRSDIAKNALKEYNNPSMSIVPRETL